MDAFSYATADGTLTVVVEYWGVACPVCAKPTTGLLAPGLGGSFMGARHGDSLYNTCDLTKDQVLAAYGRRDA